jgi:thiamine biosynthesis lipoprotein
MTDRQRSPTRAGTDIDAKNRVSRRCFLSGMGVLAAAGALAPAAAQLGIGRLGRARRAESFEAGRPALGTWMRIQIRHTDPTRASAAMEAAFAAVRRVDEQMSVHRPTSQLSLVNAAAGRAAVAVDREVIEVVARACDAARRSGGVYDPTVLPLMRLFGFYGSNVRRFPSDIEIQRVLDRTGWEHALLDERAGTLGVARAGGGLDLGSIGKGWAVDRAVAALREHGVRSALVDLGGNVYGLGTPEDGTAGWSVGVFHPVSGKLDHVFVLRDAAVATSGNSEQSQILGGMRVGHLFDMRRGRPADGYLAVSVQARSGIESDYLSTAAYLLGPSRFRGWSEALTAHFIG